MTGRLILHIGSYKTGSTAIQACLDAGAWSAEGAELIYPGGAGNHIGFARALKRPWDEHAERMSQKLVGEIRAAPEAVAILSAEHFSTVEPERLLQWVRDYLPEEAETVRVIGYVRPHAERFMSAFAERVKLGTFHGDLDDFNVVERERRVFDYRKQYQDWRGVFGDRLSLKPFVRSRFKDGDVVADFFDQALPGREVTFTADTTANPSLSQTDLALMKLVHEEFRRAFGPRKFDIVETAAIGNFVSRSLLLAPAGEKRKLKLPRHIATDLSERYAEDAAWMDEAYFGGSPMSDALARALETAVEERQTIQPEALFATEEVRRLRVVAQSFAKAAESDWGAALPYLRRGAQDLLHLTASEDGLDTIAGVKPDITPPSEAVKTLRGDLKVLREDLAGVRATLASAREELTSARTALRKAQNSPWDVRNYGKWAYLGVKRILGRG